MPFIEVPGPRAGEVLKVAYDVEGQGAPIVLVHGFGSSRMINWKTTSWYTTLTNMGRQVIAMDVRGHGASDKPHEAAAYDERELGNDVLRLMDHLNVERADVMGYSMGGFILLRLVAEEPARLRKAVIAGVGENYFGRTRFDAEAIAAALRAPDVSQVKGTVPKQFRLFAEQSKNDLEALALCMTRRRDVITAFPDNGVPVLLVVGSNDAIAGDPTPLATAIPHAQLVRVPNRDHMLTVGDRIYKEAVVSFLEKP